MSMRKKTNFILREDYPIVDTPKGRIHGYVDGDVFCFHGIDYARAKRFHMAEQVPAWEGVKNAFDYGYGVPEMTYSIKGKVPEFELLVPQNIWLQGEDCLNLNIWTKSIEPNAKKPVMVYFHGGGFFGGSATHLHTYEGWELAENYDVVVVTVNHRLNMLGFFDLSDYGEQFRHSGCHGLIDLTVALGWIRENISCFGGDPDNVTIFGQSGGGAKVTAMLQMPAADGLYRQAIMQSGIPAPKDMGYMKILAGKVMDRLGLTKDTTEKISEMDFEILAKVVLEEGEKMGLRSMELWSPTPDGEYFIGWPQAVGFRRETKDIPLLVGSNLAEFFDCPLGDKSKWTEDQRINAVRKQLGKDTEEGIRLFKEIYPEMDAAYAGAADQMFRPEIVRFLNQRVREGATPVYNYMFTFESTYMGGMLPGHNAELHFVFHNAHYVEAMVKKNVSERLEAEMAGAWTAFARTGNPNHELLPEWKAYDTEHQYAMALGDHTMLKELQDGEWLELCKRSKQNQYEEEEL